MAAATSYHRRAVPRHHHDSLYGRFLAGLRQVCDREGIALIFDEVYSGWGKAGQLFAFMARRGARRPVHVEVVRRRQGLDLGTGRA